MDAQAMSLLELFEKKMRLEVPLFQRAYVWNEEHQWQPLWEDIERKFREYAAGRRDGPAHFLGAMVLDQVQTPTAFVEKRQVIDGQQRLSTLQIFLAAFRDFCKARGDTELADECESFTLNRGKMADREVEQFKVWPTQRDRPQFMDVMVSGSRDSVEAKHPLTYCRKKPQARPLMVEAYLFFYNQLTTFFSEPEEAALAQAATLEPALSTVSESADAVYQQPPSLEDCFKLLKSALKVVVIDLSADDDAQVIFETLNARGAPLLPADLLRNFIFLRAARKNENPEQLYAEFWEPFDDGFWRAEVRQGRIVRPRSDLFMQHFLASRTMNDIPVKHLFVEYQDWIRRTKPFPTVREELSALARQRDDFRRLLEPKAGDPIQELAAFLDTFDVRTSYPLMLALLDAEISASEWEAVSAALQSYVLRRAVCGWTTKNYNRVFLSLTRNLHRTGVTSANLVQQLLDQAGVSTGWPPDDSFRAAWLTGDAYNSLGVSKVEYVLRRLDSTFMVRKMEKITVGGDLTIEHIMPQGWIENWPLADGTTGVESWECWSASEDDPIAGASKKRHALVHTLGNLTLLSQALNSSVSNGAWEEKRPELMRHSLLPINQALHDVAKWDEESIQRRAEDLFGRALKLWPRGRAVA
jgi:hypothetical protein